MAPQSLTARAWPTPSREPANGPAPAYPRPTPWRADAPEAGAMLRVAVLEPPRPAPGLAALLAGRAGVAAASVRSVADLAALVRAGRADAALVDPELDEGWPAEVAARVADALAGAVPLVLVCRSALDAAVLAHGSGGLRAAVLLRERLTAADLEAVLRGEAAKRRAGIPAGGLA